MLKVPFTSVLLIAGISLFTASSCLQHTGIPNGMFITYGSHGVSGNYHSHTYKHNMRCTYSILGVAAFGDASVETTAKRAGIKKITSVNHETRTTLGFYGRMCTKVYGY